MANRAAQQWGTFARVWYLLDASQQPPGRIAALVSPLLQGKHKPIYHPLSDIGDHVVIYNTREVAFSGDKWNTKLYHHHTGYPKGFSSTKAKDVHLLDPTKVVHKAIYGMLPKVLLRRTMMERLHLYPDNKIPEDILANISEQITPPRIIPRKLTEYSQEELDNFPKLWHPGEDPELR
ncbi:large ribosomal subunit protein uL13m-like [Saccoglossus kowalevskii]|uniref:39S ribosomal protein L13, mitochondrial-like n=1 Tax=Saccoglossus kowalevskii TaxID=10224 RepID=A0ABM0GK33_SACKO|nr:PREDICTED: 39S ribosomal protein L13, mitochondrial-like [Saccoglossus kowalevskii]